MEQIYNILLVFLPLIAFFLGVWVQYRSAKIKMIVRNDRVDVHTYNFSRKNIRIIDGRKHDETTD